MPRTSSLAALAVASALLLSGQTPVPHMSRGTPSVGIFMDFESSPAPRSVEVMKNEVNKLMKSAGVSLVWHLTKENRGKQAFNGLVVLKFKGTCRAEGWTNPVAGGAPSSNFTTLREAAPLGETQVASGEVLPFTEVECDRIRQALEYLEPGATVNQRQSALGLALGRVVAHELYHVLARTTRHAASGLAKASETLEDLVSNREMSFGAEDSLAIRNGLTGSR